MWASGSRRSRPCGCWAWTHQSADARSKLTQLITGRSLRVMTTKQDSFGRWLSHLWVGPESDLVSQLMREWMAEQGLSQAA